MNINSLEIKNKTTYVINNISYIDDFNINSLRVTKKNQELMLIFIILDVLLAKMMIILQYLYIFLLIN